MFFGDWLQRREMLSPNKVALIDVLNNDQALTYYQWKQSTNHLAHYLRESSGVTKGDRISTYSTNSVEYLEALFACNKLGAILQVINWRLTPGELVDIINNATPKVMIYSQEWREQERELQPKLSSVEAYINLDKTALENDISWELERVNWPQTQTALVELDWEDPWIICYTGGTTGLPKGAALNYRSVTWNSINTTMSWGLRPDDVVPQNMPMYHTGWLNVLTIPLST